MQPVEEKLEAAGRSSWCARRRIGRPSWSAGSCAR